MPQTGQRLQRGLPEKGANKRMRHAGVFNSNKVGCLSDTEPETSSEI